MPDGLCAVLLAAGAGTRLRPLTGVRPKALCPVGNRPLLDRALDAVASLGLTGPDRVAVNAWHHAGAIVDHLTAPTVRAHVAVEPGPEPLGSAGGLAALRDWIDGRDTVVGNADAYLTGGDLAGLVDGWSGKNVRMLVVSAGDRSPEFGAHRFAGFSVIPWEMLRDLPDGYGDLVESVWRPAEAEGRLRLIEYAGRYLDTGTPADYLAANLSEAALAGGVLRAPGTGTGTATASVIGAGARVDGAVDRCVVWPGAVVAAGERLERAIRFGSAPEATVRVP